jgi:ribosomal protein S12 methylthiotransferase accessory factor
MRGSNRIPARPDEVRTLTDHALYYAPAERAQACEFLRRGDQIAIPLGDLAEPREISLDACLAGLKTAGIRVAVKDLTSPDVAASPFRVARALGPDIQPIDFGFELRRLGNPRLQARLAGPLNPHPHPVA